MGVNIQLNKGGKVAGFITDAMSGTGIITDHQNQFFQLYNNSGEVVGGGFVRDNSTGEYALARSVAPGDYILRTGSMFSGQLNTPYIDEKYDDVPCPGLSCDLTAGTTITVVSEATTPNINLALTTGFTFSGTITELGGGAPIPDVHVLVYDADGDFASWATTDINGDFNVTGLPAGTYYALTNNGSNLPFMGVRPTASGGWIDILYNNMACPGSSCNVTDGTAIVLGGPAAPEGAQSYDFNLNQGATISGYVYDAVLGEGIDEVNINIYTASGEYIGAVQSNADGFYQTSGLPAGDYRLSTSSLPVTVDQVYGGSACQLDACDLNSGQIISMQEQQQMEQINWLLKRDYVYKANFE